ncbi:RodZ domain-containing protein [Candidatus Marithrix sp. Canyon 246]|uniref:RodZ domain-containing protein n=1 Tax=Candidatus Marithrix sp. Canyon 246 TaxID=1827136 RepID=UPI00084A2D9B|nr:RodZ domain-containing protein [Candidatus Marithrix sp. Canyon 246]
MNDETKKSDDIEEVSVEETTEEKEAPKPEISPGAILRKAREDNNLSVGHVADRLCLDIRVIEGLENDNYDKLPSTIFIRGYLRSYAKLLEIPEKSIADGFDHINKSQQLKTIIPTPKIKHQKQATSLDLWPKLVSILLVITVIVLMVIWQFYPNEEEETSVAQLNPTHTDPWANDNAVSPQNDHNGINNATTTVVSQNTTQTGTVTETTSEESQTITEEVEETPAVELDHTLTVHFKRRVWLRIQDSDGKQLYEGIGNKNQVLPVKGTPPYKIKVGNRNIDIEYLSETKNIRQFSKDDGTYIIGTKEE